LSQISPRTAVTPNASLKQSANKLIERIRSAFPEDAWVADKRTTDLGFDPHDTPPQWIEHFSRRTTDALTGGDNDRATAHLALLSGLLRIADSTTLECIDVYYVEPLMWGMSAEAKRDAWKLIPKNLQDWYVRMWGQQPFMGKHAPVR